MLKIAVTILACLILTGCGSTTEAFCPKYPEPGAQLKQKVKPLEALPEGAVEKESALPVVTRNNRVLLMDRERLEEWQRWWGEVQTAVKKKGP